MAITGRLPISSRSTLASAAAGGLALCAVLPAVPAHAAERASLGLRFRIDPAVRDCPSELDFRETVRARLGYDPFQSRGSPALEVVVEANANGLLGRLAWQESGDRSGGQRAFSSKVQNCHELLEDMAFAVAVQIQLLWEAEPTTEAKAKAPLREVENPSSTKRPGVQPKRDEISPGPASSSPAPPPVGNSRLVLLVGAGPSLGSGLAPSVVFLARAFAAVRVDVLSLGLGAEASSQAGLAREGGGGFDARVYAASAAGCYHWSSWFGCGVGRLGTLSVRGFGVDEPKRATGWVGWLGVRGGARLPLTARLSFGAYAELTRALGSRSVELDERTVWRLPSVSVTSGIDLGFSFL